MKIPLFAKRLLGAVIGSALAVTIYSAYEFAAPKLTARLLEQSVVSSAESMHGIAPAQEKAQTQVGEDAKKILERIMPKTIAVSSSSSLSSASSPEPASVMETSNAIEHQETGENLSKSGIGEWLAVFVALGLAAIFQRKLIVSQWQRVFQ
jgi:hypothetical protein